MEEEFYFLDESRTVIFKKKIAKKFFDRRKVGKKRILGRFNKKLEKSLVTGVFEEISNSLDIERCPIYKIKFLKRFLLSTKINLYYP